MIQTNESAKTSAIRNFNDVTRSEVNFGYQFNTLCDITNHFNIISVVEKPESDDLINTDDIVDVIDVIGITSAINACDKAVNNGSDENTVNCVKSSLETAAMFDPTGLVSLASAFIYPVCDVPKILFHDTRTEDEKAKAKVRVDIYFALYKSEFAKLKAQNQYLMNQMRLSIDDKKTAIAEAEVNLNYAYKLLKTGAYGTSKHRKNHYTELVRTREKELKTAKFNFDKANKNLKEFISDLQLKAHNVAIMNEITTNPDLAPGLTFQTEIIPSQENFTDMLGVALTGYYTSTFERTDFFTTGSDGSLMTIDYNGTTFNDWRKIDILPVVSTSGPAAITDNSAFIHVFFRGGDQGLYRVKFLNGGNWLAPENLGGVLYSAPAACTDGINLTVIAIGPKFTLMLKYFDGTNWKEWVDISKKKTKK